MSRRRHAGCEGFTIIELLVIIGIIMILLGLLLPVSIRVREAARAVQCASQLRQIGQAIINYTTSNQGLLPAWSGTHSWPEDVRPDDPDGPGWIALTCRFAGVSNAGSPLFSCPSFGTTGDGR